jgi:hypothetical protein
MRPRILVLLVAGWFVALPARGPAQIGLSPVQDYLNKTALLNNILSNVRATDLSQRAQTGASASDGKGGGTADPSKNPPTAPTQFQPVGESVLPKVLAERAGGEPLRQQEAERFFQSLISQYEQTAQNDGFPANDLAYAMEYLIVNGYMIYHDLHDVPYEKDPRVKRGQDSFERLQIMAEKKALRPTITQERAVYHQIQVALAANPEVHQLTDRQKQELTELLAIMLGVNLSAYLNGVNTENERMITQVREATKAHLERLLGVPMTRIRIDESGLVQ